jgi:hypothetical protein
MSIDAELRDCVRRGMLHILNPRAPGSVSRRVMLLTQPLWDLLHSPEGDDEWEKRVAELRADLEVFAEGMPVTPKYLFLLYPAENCVWEIRSVRSAPSIRVLGFFAKRDIFVATNFALREDLGGWQSREWKQVKRYAQAKWRWLFKTFQPRSGTDIKTLVTGAIDGKYFKDPTAA